MTKSLTDGKPAPHREPQPIGASIAGQRGTDSRTHVMWTAHSLRAKGPHLPLTAHIPRPAKAQAPNETYEAVGRAGDRAVFVPQRRRCQWAPR